VRPRQVPAPVFARRIRIRFGLVCLAVFGGCAAEQPARMGPRALPADSAAILATALQRARPAFDTQAEALRAGVYRAAPPHAAAAAASAPVTRPAAPNPAVPPAAPAQRPDDVMVRQRSSEPGRVTGDRSGATRAEYVVQIAAFHDLSSAERAATLARRNLPGIPVRIDEDAGLYRVSMGRWLDAAAAGLRLDEIREFYPSAWVRLRAVP
jgi:cell division protein FtsN